MRRCTQVRGISSAVARKPSRIWRADHGSDAQTPNVPSRPPHFTPGWPSSPARVPAQLVIPTDALYNGPWPPGRKHEQLAARRPVRSDEGRGFGLDPTFKRAPGTAIASPHGGIFDAVAPMQQRTRPSVHDHYSSPPRASTSTQPCPEDKPVANARSPNLYGFVPPKPTASVPDHVELRRRPSHSSELRRDSPAGILHDSVEDLITRHRRGAAAQTDHWTRRLGQDQKASQRDRIARHFVKKPILRKFKDKSQRAKPDIFVPDVISVGNLARLLGVKLRTLQYAMIRNGMQDNSHFDQILSSEYAALLVQEFGRNAVVDSEAAFDIYPSPPHAQQSSLPARPPIVTVMGHVDHGKTTLLDTLRSASVAKGEAGGITQHIGAFSVPLRALTGAAPEDTRTITFLDTPGHAAFAAMRARGAGVTDIVVLVVAADDGVMAQTREVIKLIKRDAAEGKLGIVVALNKVDKPAANIEKVQNSLLEEGLELESHGGDVPCVAVSGLTGTGLPELVETLSVLSEMMDLRAETTDCPVHGTVLESKVAQGVGPIATVLIHRGALTPGMTLIAGGTSARVRLLSDHTGAAISMALPGAAVTVAGWKDLPAAGDEVLSGAEDDVRRALENRARREETSEMLADAEAINTYRRAAKEQHEADAAAEALIPRGRPGIRPRPPPVVRMRDEASLLKENGPRELRIVVKGDVSGSVEALVGALQEIGNAQACVKIVHSGVGDVTESDVSLAQTAEGIVVAFAVKVPRAIASLAHGAGVDVHQSGIIYRLTDDVRRRLSKLIPPIIEKHVTGEATVLQLFDIDMKGKSLAVAGCRITNGAVQKSRLARVVRDGTHVFEGEVETLRHLKKDVTEIKKGHECGLSLTGFADIRVGDMVQVLQVVEKPVML